MKTDHWDEPLGNWGIWYVGGRELGRGPTSSAWEYAGRSKRGDGPIQVPAVVGLALDTDRLVSKLPDESHTAVVAWYAWTGTYDERARAMGIHRNTLSNRVTQAKERLDAIVERIRAAQAAERRKWLTPSIVIL